MGAAARQGPLSQVAQNFLNENQRFIARGKRRRRRNLAVLVVLVVFLAATTVTATVAEDSTLAAKATISQQRDGAIADTLANESESTGDANATAARLESLASWAVAPGSAQADYAMLRAVSSPEIAALNSGTSFGPVSAVAFNQGGTMMLTVHQDGTVELWDVAARKQVGSLHTGIPGVVAAAFSPEGPLVAAWDGDTGYKVGIWNVATGKKVQSLQFGSRLLARVQRGRQVPGGRL